MTQDFPRRSRLTRFGWWLAAALLALTLALGLPCGRFALRVYRQQRVISEFARLNLAGVFTVPGKPSWLRRWVGDERAALLDEVRVIVVWSRDEFTDEHLKLLASLESVQDLDLGGTRITDEGLRSLRSLTNLQRLALEDTHITDTGLIHLRQLKHLGLLTLQGTPVTPAGIAELQAALPETLIRGPGESEAIHPP